MPMTDFDKYDDDIDGERAGRAIFAGALIAAFFAVLLAIRFFSSDL